MVVQGKCKRLKAPLFHYTYENIHDQFEMPEIDIKSFDVDKSWIIRLLVEMSEKGYPVQVFIEKGSNIPDVDAKIIRMVNQSRLNEPGKSCEGRVTINFGL